MTRNEQSFSNFDTPIMNFSLQNFDREIDGYNWYAYCENDPINYIDPLGLDIIKPQSKPLQQDKNSASQEGIAGEIHKNWGFNSTIRNYGCVYITQCNGAQDANDHFKTGNKIDPSEHNTKETFGEDQEMTDAEREKFQEKTTGLEVTTYRVEGNAKAIKEIERLQNDPSVQVTIEARVKPNKKGVGTHSINVYGIDTLEDGTKVLNSHETASYFETKGNTNTVADITGIRVNIYTEKKKSDCD